MLWNKIDVSTNIEKHHVQAKQQRDMYAGRNINQKDVLHDHDDEGNNKHGTLEELHANGEAALEVGEESFDKVLADNHFVVADFYAPWCIWCQRLAPTWEAFAEKVDSGVVLKDHHSYKDTKVIKVDCEKHSKLCGKQSIGAFPTLRMFFFREKLNGDFKGDRTVDAFTDWLEHAHEEKHAGEDHVDGTKKEVDKTPLQKAWVADDHPGCRINGNIWVNRVPGRIQIEAGSAFQNINPKMANVSHIVNHLGFGVTLNKRMYDKLKRVPDGFKQVAPLNGNAYVTDQLHTAHHHHMNVVPTEHLNPIDANMGERILGSLFAASLAKVIKGWRPWGEKTFAYNQLNYQSQMIHFKDDEVPSITFAYDISPLVITIEKSTMPTYEFVVKLFALIGGTYTLFGVMERGVSSVSKKRM
jgi:thiol-disulfide isomerase/thioredoxin